METEHFDKEIVSEDTPEYSYEHYKELDGIINEKDYASSLEKSRSLTSMDKSYIRQAQNIAGIAGIELNISDEDMDPRVKLYYVLRSDIQPEDVKHHHSQLSDQRLFLEVLRMLEDAGSAEKMKVAYHINRPLGTYCTLCGRTYASEDCV